MVVIYAEKASLAKCIALALHAGNRHSNSNEPTIGYWEFSLNGEKAIICHGVGHLVELCDAREYGEKFSKWNLDNYPCIPDAYKIREKEQTKTCFDFVKTFFEKADWLINATDPDREGELIFGYVYEKIGMTIPWKRVILNDLTEKTICNAFKSLKTSSEMQPLQNAGRCRSISDWLIGINLTIAMTVKYGNNNLLPIGRVQTPTLNMVVEREKAIKNHTKTPYWKLVATFVKDDIKFKCDYKNGAFKSHAEAQQVLSDCVKCASGEVIIVEQKQRIEPVPLLYNATQLQIEASKKLGWKIEKTAAIMQRLYENKLMSYPRTSSEHLTDAMKSEVLETINKLFQLAEYSEYMPQHYEDFTSRHFDNSKVGSHTAIIPTMAVPSSLSALSDDERSLYDLIAKSLIRIVLQKATFIETTVEINVGANVFRCKNSISKIIGWKVFEKSDDKNIVLLPCLQKGDVCPGTYELIEGETEPPKRYTEATLIGDMELAGKRIEDEEARTIMKLQNMGLGTDATRTQIIKSLFAKGLIAEKGKSVIPTDKGLYLIDTLPVAELKSAEITGQWEKLLHDISLQKFNPDEFLSKITVKTKEWYNLIVSDNTHMKYIEDNADTYICPCCGQTIQKGKNNFYCIGYKNNSCSFSVPFVLCNKKLTNSQITTLINNGRTAIIKGFKSKSGNSFDASLKINKANKKIEFVFANSKK